MTNPLENGLTVEAFARSHAISRTQAYREIAAGRLTASKVGRRTIITSENARLWRTSLPSLQREKA